MQTTWLPSPGGSVVQQISRVLAAVDFSKPARGAFEYALALSQRHAAELVVVQAVPLNLAFGWHARERFALIAKLRRRADLANVEFQDRVQQGDPAKIILSHADSLHPDRIVVGTHLADTTTEISRVVERIGADLLPIGVTKRGVVSRALFGTTPARLLRVSRVPILAVPEVKSASRHQEAASLTLAA